MNIKPKTKPAAGKRTPKKISETYLHNAGLYYLQRFSAGSAHFREVMMRKVRKSCAHHADQDSALCAAMVDDLVRKFIASGLLNDDLYAQGMVASLRRRGKSEKAVAAKLQSLRIPAPLIRAKMAEHDDSRGLSSTQSEMEAARAFARKKRLGPFAGGRTIAPEKALGAFARAGFSYDIARKILNTDMDGDVE